MPDFFLVEIDCGVGTLMQLWTLDQPKQLSIGSQKSSVVFFCFCACVVDSRKVVYCIMCGGGPFTYQL